MGNDPIKRAKEADAALDASSTVADNHLERLIEKRMKLRQKIVDTAKVDKSMALPWMKLYNEYDKKITSALNMQVAIEQQRLVVSESVVQHSIVDSMKVSTKSFCALVNTFRIEDVDKMADENAEAMDQLRDTQDTISERLFENVDNASAGESVDFDAQLNKLLADDEKHATASVSTVLSPPTTAGDIRDLVMLPAAVATSSQQQQHATRQVVEEAVVPISAPSINTSINTTTIPTPTAGDVGTGNPEVLL
jgi:hypothetical protein